MSKLQPLTAEEQKMAADYFYLVDRFLRRKRLDPNEYYDVAIFGYLEAIQRECRNQNPPENKNIYALIEVCMDCAVRKEWRRQYAEKRRGDRESLSLDSMPASTEEGEFSLYEVVADTRQNTAIQVEAKDLTERILAVATLREREAINLSCMGYEAHEIAEILYITRNTASRTLCNFRVKAKAVRDDREVIRSPQYAKDKEKIQARNRAYWQAHKLELNEKKRINNRAYRKNHKEEIKAKDRAYREAHKEEIRARDRAYREAHREEINARRRARRAAIRGEKLAQG